MMGCRPATHHFYLYFLLLPQRAVCMWVENPNFHHHLPICLLISKIREHKHAHTDVVCDPNLTLYCLMFFSYCFVGFLYYFLGFLQFSFRFVYLFGFQLIFYQEISIINQQIHKNLKTKTLLKKNNKFHNPNQLQDFYQEHKKI